MTAFRISGGHVIGLDLLRFLAAVMVVMLHVVGATVVPGVMVDIAKSISGVDVSKFRSAGPWWSYLGFLGVPIFFSISGFVISLSARDQTLKGFIRSRWTRLVPMLWIATIIGFCIQVASSQMSFSAASWAFVRSVLLLPFGPYIDGVVWTLVIEVVFYSIIAAWIVFDKSRRFHILALIISLLSTLYWAFYFYNGCEGSFISSSSSICLAVESQLLRKIAALSMLTYGGFFTAGVLLCWGWAARKMRFAALLSLPSLFAGACQIIVSVRWMVTHYGANGAEDKWVLAVSIWIFALSWIWLSLLTNSYLTVLPKSVGFLSRQIGLSTYPLYLVHSLMAGVFMGVALRAGAGIYISITIALAGVTVSAFGLSYWVEPQARRLMTSGYDVIFSFLDSVREKYLRR